MVSSKTNIYKIDKKLMRKRQTFLRLYYRIHEYINIPLTTKQIVYLLFLPCYVFLNEKTFIAYKWGNNITSRGQCR